jgi:hypothetical protein
MDTRVFGLLTSGVWQRARVTARRAGPLAVAAAMVALPLTLILSSSCTRAQTRDGVAASYLIVNSLTAASGAEPDAFGGTLASDVLTKGGVYADPGQVTFTLALKDPGSSSSPTAPTTTNFITVTRYHVDFVRSDGRKTPGVDVPYSFDGAATATVTDEGGSLTLTVVRVQAKLEGPLVTLAGGGGADVISTIAQITFYGNDQAGRPVSVMGKISVNFADWADPK